MDKYKKDGRLKSEDIPSHVEESRKEGERHRREMDEIPPPGADPLNEGP